VIVLRSQTVRPTAYALLLVLSFATPAGADFQAGADAYDRGDYATALREWRPLVEQGDATAQYNLGLLYANGQGMPQDDAQAGKWYAKAALQGHAKAQVDLGDLCIKGQGIPQDYTMALFLCRLAADQGNALAQVKLGRMYERGKGVPQDFVQANMWYNLGAANGEKFGAELRDALAKRMIPSQIAEAHKLAREWKPKTKLATITPTAKP
jgi:TPR repeat protein